MKRIQLIRFFDDEHWAHEFCKGNISLSYLGAYWGEDLEKLQEEKEREKWDTKEITPPKYGRDDYYEGAVVVKGKECPELPSEFSKYTIGNVIFRVEAYKYCNLLCMCIVDYDDQNGRIYLPDTEYFKKNFNSKCAVVLRDTDEFLRRIDDCMSRSGYDYVYGRVNYSEIIGDYSIINRHSAQVECDVISTGLSEIMDNGRMLDVFDKEKLLRKQREWRLCVHRKVQVEERYNPDPKLSSLTDIAEVVPVDRVCSALLRQHPGYKFGLVQPNKESDYRGNISREDLQRKICEDGRYKILFNMG